MVKKMYISRIQMVKKCTSQETGSWVLDRSGFKIDLS